jgi:hypothetical protein
VSVVGFQQREGNRPKSESGKSEEEVVRTYYYQAVVSVNSSQAGWRGSCSVRW